ncbi:hypothetical protein [Kordiimonas sp.]|uniref:hypothetical protein n=1 Tax=Kordiimonas sp. TaxID=1970157 RepID=UPI003A8EF51A
MQIPHKFSPWISWTERTTLANLRLPGIYILRLSKTRNIASQPFDWCPEIIYVGMSNSKAGLKGRLKQFDRTINMKEGHGGACRVRHKHRDYDALVQSLYVAVQTFDCDPSACLPNDFRTMGQVALLEYDCLATFLEKFGRLPEFNDRSSPKYHPENQPTKIQV